jgi:hypothetical protein
MAVQQAGGGGGGGAQHAARSTRACARTCRRHCHDCGARRAVGLDAASINVQREVPCAGATQRHRQAQVTTTSACCGRRACLVCRPHLWLAAQQTTRAAPTGACCNTTSAGGRESTRPHTRAHTHPCTTTHTWVVAGVGCLVELKARQHEAKLAQAGRVQGSLFRVTLRALDRHKAVPGQAHGGPVACVRLCVRCVRARILRVGALRRARIPQGRWRCTPPRRASTGSTAARTHDRRAHAPSGDVSKVAW